MSNLCLTLAEQSLARLQRKLESYCGQVPLIEIRLDYLDQLSLPVLPNAEGTQFLATCRPVREGGRFEGEESLRLNLLSGASRSGFHWIDIEHDVADLPEIAGGVSVVRSLHAFEAFPASLEDIYRRLRGLSGDVVKIAVPIYNSEDLVSLLQWQEGLPRGSRHIIIGMGDFGQPSRFLGHFLGNAWTFIAESAVHSAAPGQFSLLDATSLYRLGSWKTAPTLYGVIGNPVVHSRSPQVHNRLFQFYGIEALYIPLQLDSLDPWFRYLKGTGFDFEGFSVTLPFKTEVVRFAEAMTSPTGSLNTIVKEDNHWLGRNTDYPAFLKPLSRKCPQLKGKSALVLGIGGVAQTVVSALRAAGVEVTVAGRDAERLKSFAERFQCRPATWKDLPIRADLCVNTTPVGQYPVVSESPLSEEQIQFDVVYDLVYNPEQTELLRLAAGRGATIITGMEMFIEQAALQFQMWTGIDPDRGLVRRYLTDSGADPLEIPS